MQETAQGFCSPSVCKLLINWSGVVFCSYMTSHANDKPLLLHANDANGSDLLISGRLVNKKTPYTINGVWEREIDLVHQIEEVS